MLRRNFCCGFQAASAKLLFGVLVQAGISVVTACGSDTGGQTYNVGSSQAYTSIASVPLTTLEPGDWICIHNTGSPGSPTVYNEKFVINRSGNALQPIVVSGVPHQITGELPILDGDGAITPTDLSYWNEVRNLIKIGGASIPTPTGGGLASYVRVQDLHLRNAHSGYMFLDDNGNSQSYVNNAACIHVEEGQHIEIVGNEIESCGNGIFIANSINIVQDVLIEANYIHSNGNVNSFYEHNTYTEALGIVYRYNRFGPLCVGCLGNNLKDRSAGLVVSYNYIEGGNRQLDLVDSSYLNSEPSYTNTEVYGNVLIEPDAAGNRQVIHFGGDSGTEANYRDSLDLYHNTILSKRVGRSTLVRVSSSSGIVYATNNIIKATETAVGNNFELLAEQRGTLIMDNNWITDGYVDWFIGYPSNGGIVTESNTVLESVTGAIFITSMDDDTNSDYLHLVTSLPSFIPALSIPREYVMHLSSQVRTSNDLGAYGFGGGSTTDTPSISPTSPPSFHPSSSPTPIPTASPTTPQSTDSPSEAPTTSTPTDVPSTPDPSGWMTILSNDFETGWQNFTDGGSDAARRSDGDNFVHSGSYALRIRDGTDASAVIETGHLDTSNYDNVRVSFWFRPRGVEYDEAFSLQTSVCDGNWTTTDTWKRGNEWSRNNRWYEVGDTTQDADFSAVEHTTTGNCTVIRFRCEGNHNSDRVYIDDVLVEGELTL